jgi:hypothetical protein
MPRRYGKSLPLRVVNLMNRGMRMLALSEMTLRSKALRKKALLGLLHQSVQKLCHPPVLIVKCCMKPPKNHVQLLLQTKLEQEQLRGGIPKNQRLLSERVFGIHRALVSEFLEDRGLMPRLSLPKQICIPKLLLGTGPIPKSSIPKQICIPKLLLRTGPILRPALLN